MSGWKQQALGFAIGLGGGCLGGMVGLGGGVVMVPLLTGVGGLGQHLAHGTSLLPVAATGLSSSLVFGQDCEINVPAAGVLMASAFATVKSGAKLQARLPAKSLKKAMGGFMVVGGLLIPVKHYFVGKPEGRTEIKSFGQKLSSDFDSLKQNPGQIALFAFTGATAGVLSGLLGVGGGILMNPVMSLASPLSQAEVVGTTLLSMIPASILGARTHWVGGNVCGVVAMPLVVGALIGASVGSRIALGVEEEHLKLFIAVALVALGARMALV